MPVISLSARSLKTLPTGLLLLVSALADSPVLPPSADAIQLNLDGMNRDASQEQVTCQH